METSLHRIDPGREIGAPVWMAAHELRGRARLRARLRNHLLDARRFRTRLEMIDQRTGMKDRPNAGEAQAQADVDVLPAVLRERFVESADSSDRREWHRDVGRPEIVTAVVPDAPDWRRQLVEIVRPRLRRHERSRCDAGPRRAGALRRSSGAARRRRR